MHQIGAGSVGPVFRGEDGETRDPVVIKVIRVGLPPERVAIVAAALATLKDRLPSHPALAGLIDTGVVDVEPYVVSPFIDGDSLDVALREFGPAQMADALPRLRHLADGMDAAAAVGAAHGSLHLRDIVVSVDQTVLTGMGIAAILERVGVRPPVRRPYCAPEAASGHGISPAADQYALAAIAHEWLSGRRLSGSGASGFQIPAVSAAGADALRAVFARAMHESVDERFPTATAFVEAIAEFAGQAAPRSRTGRRAPAVEAPRLAFDESPEESDAPDEPFASADGAGAYDDALQAAPDSGSDPLDAPLHAAPASAAPSWDADDAPDAPPAFSALEDDEAADAGVSGDQWTADAADEAALDDAPPTPDPETGDTVGGSWGAWALVLALATVSVLAGGWLLLRWGTPAPASMTTGGRAATTAGDAAASSGAGQAAAVAPGALAAPPGPPAATLPATPPGPRAGGTAARAVPPAPPPPAVSAAPRPAASAAPRPAPRPAAAAPSAAEPAPPRPASPRSTRAASATAGAPAAAGGRVLVRTTPGGAEVFVNGERRGVTPLALRDLPFGAYTVRVVRAGFTAVEQRVAIDPGRPARSLEIALARTPAAGGAAPAAAAAAAAPGSLLVDSRPPGARVIVDGADVGVTPVTVPTLAPGSHSVRIERPGYAPIMTTARVESRQRARVAVTLTAERPR